MIQKTTKTIDGATFEFTQMGFEQQQQMFVVLAKTVGPSLAKLLAAMPSVEALQAGHFDSDGASDAVVELITHLNNDTLSFLFEEFGKSSRFLDGTKDAKPYMQKEIRANVFRGRMLLSFKWLAASIEVNYADFFDAWRAAKDAAQAAKESPDSPSNA